MGNEKVTQGGLQLPATPWIRACGTVGLFVMGLFVLTVGPAVRDFKSQDFQFRGGIGSALAHMTMEGHS